MKRLAIGLLTVFLVGVGQPLFTMTGVVAKAQVTATASNTKRAVSNENDAIITKGKFGTVDFYLTAAGDLHLGPGRFPDHVSTPDDLGRGQLISAVTKAYFNRPNITLNNLQTVTKLVTRVILDGPIQAAVNASHTFSRLNAVTTYVNLDQLDTSQTENMAAMFSENAYVTQLDISHFDTRRVTDMNIMFSSMKRVLELDVSHFNMDNVKNVNSMFSGTAALKQIDFSRGTFAVTEQASQMIAKSGVERLNLPLFEAPGKSNNMLYAADSLSQLTLGPKAQQEKVYSLKNAPKNAQYTGVWQIVGTGTVDNPLGEKFSTGSEIGKIDPDREITQAETYVWEPVNRIIPPVTPPPVTPPPVTTAQPVTVRYLDERSQPLAPARRLTGELGTAYRASAMAFSGYRLAKTSGQVAGTFTTEAQQVTFHYEPDLVTGGDGDGIAPISTVVYATKKVGLYRHKDFSAKTRQHWYAKQKRTHRPMFVVTGFATSKNGHLRYRVRDVNHRSKTAGKVGYLTANRSYVQSVYYATKQSRIRVLNPKGVNSYRQVALKGKQRHYRQGATLRIKKIVKYRKTTRFVLTTCDYVTANKKLVIIAQ